LEVSGQFTLFIVCSGTIQLSTKKSLLLSSLVYDLLDSILTVNFQLFKFKFINLFCSLNIYLSIINFLLFPFKLAPLDLSLFLTFIAELN